MANTAAVNVPARLAPSTTLQRRIMFESDRLEKSAMIGSTGVIVFSVNSCMRPRITIMNPTQ